jgi:hypothetical protein
MKRIGFLAAAVLALGCAIGGGSSQVYGQTARVSSVKSCDAATATGACESHQLQCTDRTFQAYGATTAGAGAATVVIEGSNKDSPASGTRVDWVTLGTITLTLATTQSGDGFASSARWRHVRGYVTAISGTNANATVWMGC